LREYLTRYPALWRSAGNLAAQAVWAWIGLAAGPDLHLQECMRLHAEALRAQLAGPSPSAVANLLAESLTVTSLQLNYFPAMEARAIGSDEPPKLAAYRAKRLEQAQRQHLAAVAALTMLRKLLPGTSAATVPNGASRVAAPPGDGNHQNGDVHNRIAS